VDSKIRFAGDFIRRQLISSLLACAESRSGVIGSECRRHETRNVLCKLKPAENRSAEHAMIVSVPRFASSGTYELATGVRSGDCER
jgi:hypothetical protein